MTTLYKLTDRNGVTGSKYGAPLQWAAGVTYEIAAEDYRGILCKAGIIHAYESPLVAVFMKLIHANYKPARLWRCETDAEVVREGQLKCGVRRLTCVEELPLPEIKTTARIRAAILCAWEVCDEPTWRAWATKWLSGEDRSAESAERARMVEAWAWVAVGTDSAALAAEAAAEAEWAAPRVVAWVRTDSALSAERAVDAKPELNLHAIIEGAIRE